MVDPPIPTLAELSACNIFNNIDQCSGGVGPTLSAFEAELIRESAERWLAEFGARILQFARESMADTTNKKPKSTGSQFFDEHQEVLDLVDEANKKGANP